MTNLPEILQQHRLWLTTNGKEGRSANLSGADLSGVDLSGVDLSRASLRDAIMSGVDLSRASLRDAILRDADLSGSDLSHADLRDADLSGADLSHAILRDADLRGSIGFPVAVDAPQRLLAVARAALAEDSALDMEHWHTCKTTHCIAGWAIHLAGELGRVLQESHGPELAGRMLLGHEAALHFYDTNDDARIWLQSVLDAAGAGEVEG